MTNPITAWVSSIPDLPMDPTRRAMVIALKAVEEELQDLAYFRCYENEDQMTSEWPHLLAARIALTDALFPPGAYPHKVSPECSCEIGSVCQHKPCCYFGGVVPDIARLQLFPPDGVAAPRAPVPEWFVADMQRKKRVCDAAIEKHPGSEIAERALSDGQLLDVLLRQATEVQP